MGREVRRVPADWQHPRDGRGHLVPLFGHSYSERSARWDEGNRQWETGLRDNYRGGWEPIPADYTGKTFASWDGDRPVPEDYMPDWPESERTHFQMYETVTEGTPISPVFATPEELARWLADTGASASGNQKASYEGWLRVARGGYAPSMVDVGNGLVSGVDGLTD